MTFIVLGKKLQLILFLFSVINRVLSHFVKHCYNVLTKEDTILKQFKIYYNITHKVNSLYFLAAKRAGIQNYTDHVSDGFKRTNKYELSK